LDFTPANKAGNTIVITFLIVTMCGSAVKNMKFGFLDWSKGWAIEP